jgi:hypothetical protein
LSAFCCILSPSHENKVHGIQPIGWQVSQNLYGFTATASGGPFFHKVNCFDKQLQDDSFIFELARFSAFRLAMHLLIDEDIVERSYPVNQAHLEAANHYQIKPKSRVKAYKYSCQIDRANSSNE